MRVCGAIILLRVVVWTHLFSFAVFYAFVVISGNYLTFAISKANWSEHMKGSSLIDIQITLVMGVLGCKTFSNFIRWIYRWLLVLDVGFCSRKKHIGFLYICPSLVLSQFNSVCNLNLLENWCQLQHFLSTLLQSLVLWSTPSATSLW